MTTIREIIQAHLRQIGADGLCHPDGDCGCGLDELFGGCGMSFGNPLYCLPAKKVIALEDGDIHLKGDEIYEEMRPAKVAKP